MSKTRKPSSSAGIPSEAKLLAVYERRARAKGIFMIVDDSLQEIDSGADQHQRLTQSLKTSDGRMDVIDGKLPESSPIDLIRRKNT
ncbi:hypothetical protein COY07_03380 [Candidatus Peregrinibacteria bacterium CG_4_10_14_0_2_um_filter_43_11]|nr:MAG: hypothetical protein COY07_03380 [Candidatus Peregrinibacteria bacterium CG_4_10_14_0_2_um_filter_43_11]